ncbi:hypothetical protein BP5796_05644 [Coleophoma crateriformis]|uniref:Uncharacterized protein n=1 Tax=Coleophoma crateriformis TaxID=565419 RepID=A0A3D8S3V6_9HELO|nr:hypothetical protein BP5796_05644 [Coleophoma crateriformis]
MNSLRSFFSRKPTNSSSPSTSPSQSQPRSNSNAAPTKVRKFTKLKGKSYDSSVAREPPVKGSYPVAGNGPNVFEEIQRSRARRDSRSQSISTGYAEPPTIPRWREDVVERPRTAPHNGLPSGQSNETTDRTMSGFAAKSPPSFAAHRAKQKSKRFSALSLSDMHKSSDVEQVQAYQPRRGLSVDDTPGFTAPPTWKTIHSRTSSSNIRASHVDLLDAYKNLVGTPEISKSAVKASGVRNYGEDVADRNIIESRGGDTFDLSSPQFSYMKNIYSSSTASGRANPKHSRFGSTFKDLQEHDDDTVLPPQKFHDRTTSRGPGTSQTQSPQPVLPVSSDASTAAPRTAHAFPPRSDSASAYQGPRGRDDAARVHHRQSRTMSPGGYDDDSLAAKYYRRQSGTFSPSKTAIRERAHSLTRDSIPLRQSSQRHSLISLHNRQSTLDSSSGSPVNFSRRTQLLSSTPVANESRTRPRTSSVERPENSSQLNSRADSSRYSTDSRYSVESRDFYDPESRRSPPAVAFAHRKMSTEARDSYDPSTRRAGPPVSMKNHGRNGALVEGAKEKPSLKGVVDLTNTVDTDVRTKQAPVTHEHVTPTVHHVREEAITREIHTHDVIHRVLPVIETEILPTKHYIQTSDGKLVEIAADQIPGRTSTPSFQIVPTKRHSTYGDSSLAGGSVVHIGHHLSAHSGPVLSSKRRSMTRDGVPKTESVWRHAPEMETGGRASGQTMPMYLDHTIDSDDSNSGDVAYTTAKSPTKAEMALLSRNGGYGNGAKPTGFTKTTSAAVHRKPLYEDVRSHDEDASESDEAMHTLKRRKEAKMRLSKAFDEGGIEAVERNLRDLRELRDVE